MVESSSNHKPPVCVTGAKGFIGTWLVKIVLDHGYTTIHASVYPNSDASHLHRLPNAPAARLVVRLLNPVSRDEITPLPQNCPKVLDLSQFQISQILRWCSLGVMYDHFDNQIDWEHENQEMIMEEVRHIVTS
ncbi:hypothetical protein Vadar_007328 [Vaccinium darrowii]|uniref:Uncharacterized protein n=1 Tax=Vaccinium darrowii TaxID=229202 RepID=A0ACB7XNU6_9ERIC|nr:hypothetical protein Vadar_007328 [Vaccinium darrowii]